MMRRAQKALAGAATVIVSVLVPCTGINACTAVGSYSHNSVGGDHKTLAEAWNGALWTIWVLGRQTSALGRAAFMRRTAGPNAEARQALVRHLG